MLTRIIPIRASLVLSGLNFADIVTTRQSRASPGQATTDSARPKTSSYNDDPARPNFGGELRLASPNRPSSAPENTQGPGKKIDDIRQLTLGQERATETRDRYGLRYNPKKRQAGGDAATPHSTLGGPNEKTASGGFSVDRDPEFSRQGNPTSNTEYHRDTLDPRKPLWDGNTDNPNTGKPRRRDRQQSSANNPSPHFNIQRVHTYSSKKHDVVKKNGRQRSHDRGQDRAVHNSNFNFNERPQKLLILGKDRPLSSEEPLPVEQRPESPEPEPDMLLQPDTRPISHEQLVVEVKGIYAGLVMVEAKCIDIDERQSAAAQEKALTKRVELKNEQWQSLIALHKQLLHEHHDFFLASQHPSASPALSKLAAKYSMPARMWRHGIHAFLEVLRHRLPSSLEHMLAFIYIAYSMMALLYETVATFEDTWIECLGSSYITL